MASGVDRVESAEYSSSVDSGGTPSYLQHHGPGKVLYSRSLQSQSKSLPVFDLRRSNFPKATYNNFILSSMSLEEVKKQVAEQFQAQLDRVLVLETQGRVEETLLQTLIIVLPESDPPSPLIVLIETFESLEQTHAVMRCMCVIQPLNIANISDQLLSELGWKAGALCRNGKVLSPDTDIKELSPGKLCKIQAIKSSLRNISLTFRPNPNVCYSYSLEVDVSYSVSKLKSTFLTTFKDDLLIREISAGQVIHIYFHEMHLQDNMCIGLILRGSKDETFSIHIAAPNAIGVTLKYRVQHGKTRIPCIQQMLVKPTCSTKDLRKEAAKYLHVDPKAVKLTIGETRIEEHDNLLEKKILKKGAAVSAGVKKKKSVLIRHPETLEECTTSLFLLESVHHLKKEISHKFKVDPLQISLQCRGMEMLNKDSLLNYPIKNKMELAMKIYHNRITVLVWIIFKKVRARLVIDDSRNTTVDDVLTFCAIKYNYCRQNSKALFQQRCLYKFNTLKQEGLESGSIIHVVYFENFEVRQDNLITFFIVRPNGNITPRLGSICGGILLHAPKQAGLRSPEKEEKKLNPGLMLPAGLHIDEDLREPEKQVHDSETESQYGDVKHETQTKGRKVSKAKLLHKAKALYQRKNDEEQTRRKLAYLEDDLVPSAASHKTYKKKNRQNESEDIKEKTSLDGQLNDESKTASFFLSESPDDVRQFSQPMQYGGKTQDTSSDQRTDSDSETDTEDSSLSNENVDQFELNKNTVQRNAGSLLYDRSQVYSSCESLNGRSFFPGFVSTSTNDSTSDMNDSSSSQDKATETVFYQNLAKFNQLSSNPVSNPVCPYLRSVVSLYNPVGRASNGQRRQRCLTSGETDLSFLQNNRQTCPSALQYFQESSNSHLETAGITLPILERVSHEVGIRWKQLARKLSVDENDIDNIEHRYTELGEKCIQSLFVWKRSGGTKATRNQLLNALRRIGMENVVEKCEAAYSYHTA